MENAITKEAEEVQKGSVDYLIHNKSIWLGLAIILIVFYHMPRVSPILNIFNPGFIGVDFFLFFSGFSLCYSYEKNKVVAFYRRRFFRIYPMYFILATIISVMPICRGGGISLLSWFCNITTLSYYKIGGSFVDWYLSSIFLFYLLFPLLYAVTKKFKWIVPITVSLLLLIIISAYDIHWWYGCAIGRLPIFLLGIFCFLDDSYDKRSFKKCCWFFFFVFLIAVFLYRKGYYMRGYFLTDMITPVLLLSISLLLSRINNCRFTLPSKILSLLGNYTLEIYVANVITMVFLGYNSIIQKGWQILLVYFAVTVLLSIILVIINRCVRRILVHNFK